MLIGAALLFVCNANQAQIPEFTRDLGFGGSGFYYIIFLAANAAGGGIAGIILESGNLLKARPRKAFIFVLI